MGSRLLLFVLALPAAVVLAGCKASSVAGPPGPPSPPAATPAPVEMPAHPVVATAPDVAMIPFGNSGPTVDSHLSNGITSFTVRRTDDALIASSEWDEGGHALSLIKDGRAMAACTATMGWGAFAQGFGAANSTHVFAALKIQGAKEMQGRSDMVSPPLDTFWWGVSVFEPNCTVRGGTYPLYRNFIKLVENVGAAGKPSADTPITGLAADDATVFVSVGALNKVFTVDAATQKASGSFAAKAPGKILIDATGHPWVVTTLGAGRALTQYDVKGHPTGKVIAGVSNSTGLGLTTANELLVTNGLSIQRYDVANTPAVTKTWTAITSGYDGTPGPFRWRGELVGASCDSAGNMFVVWRDGARSVYEAYSPTDQLLWQKFALTNDEPTAPILNDDGASADAYDGTDVFTVRFDASPPSWTWKGHLVNALEPKDNSGTMMVEKVGDRRLFLKANHYSAGPVTLLTHSVGTLLEPRVTYQVDPGGTNWYWHLHPNGDLCEVLHSSGFYYFSFKGYDAAGVPRHQKSKEVRPPDPIDDKWGGGDPFDRAIYDAGKDILLVAGPTDKKPRGSVWGEFTVLVAYSGFGAVLKDGDQAHLVQKWRIDFPSPTDPSPLVPAGAAHARGLWIVGDAVVAQFEESESLIRYDLATGAYFDQFAPHVPSWDDVNAGLQGIALPDGRMFLTILSITQESAVGVLWKGPRRAP